MRKRCLGKLTDGLKLKSRKYYTMVRNLSHGFFLYSLKWIKFNSIQLKRFRTLEIFPTHAYNQVYLVKKESIYDSTFF
jgi:hypothetical protein